MQHCLILCFGYLLKKEVLACRKTNRLWREATKTRMLAKILSETCPELTEEKLDVLYKPTTRYTDIQSLRTVLFANRIYIVPQIGNIDVWDWDKRLLHSISVPTSQKRGHMYLTDHCIVLEEKKRYIHILSHKGKVIARWNHPGEAFALLKSFNDSFLSLLPLMVYGLDSVIYMEKNCKTISLW